MAAPPDEGSGDTKPHLSGPPQKPSTRCPGAGPVPATSSCRPRPPFLRGLGSTPQDSCTNQQVGRGSP